LDNSDLGSEALFLKMQAKCEFTDIEIGELQEDDLITASAGGYQTNTHNRQSSKTKEGTRKQVTAVKPGDILGYSPAVAVNQITAKLKQF